MINLSKNTLFIEAKGEEKGVIHFIGGFFYSNEVHSYNRLLITLANEGFAILNTRYGINCSNHTELSNEIYNNFNFSMEELKEKKLLKSQSLPIYGLGHSLGCKIHLLICSYFATQRKGNIFISYNNLPVQKGFSRFLGMDLSLDNDSEHTPSSEDTFRILDQSYEIRHNLLINYDKDFLCKEQSNILKENLCHKSIDFQTRQLKGNHSTPNIPIPLEIEKILKLTFRELSILGKFSPPSIHPFLIDLVDKHVSEYLSLDMLIEEILHWLLDTNEIKSK